MAREARALKPDSSGRQRKFTPQEPVSRQTLAREARALKPDSSGRQRKFTPQEPVSRQTLAKETSGGKSGSPIGQTITKTGQTISIVAKEVTSVSQTTLKIVGVNSGATKTITLTIVPGVSKINQGVDGKKSPFA
jgi:hypothetical protein